MNRPTDQPVIYLDHAATSWPKPAAVLEAMQRSMLEEAANPGRGGHRMAIAAGRVLLRARMALGELLGVSNPSDIAFMSNTTAALNQAVKGLLRPGDHVVATMTEHNSVWRPLEYMRREHGVSVDYAAADESGAVDLGELASLCRPATRLIVCSHSSNLLGSILPVAEIADIAHRHGAVMLVDAAQSAGAMDLDVGRLGIDLLAFPGHKGLLGPQGTGGLYIHPSIDLAPLLHGGTGSQSEEADQPSVRPDRYEAGTPNTVGIAGLEAGVRHVLSEGAANIGRREWELTQIAMQELAGIKGLRLLGPSLGKPRTGIVSFTIEGMDSARIAFRLDREYGIAVRAGYHCTPLAHQAAGTASSGAVRGSFGFDSTPAEAHALIQAVREIAGSRM
ncbi:aminotransferase class V-fold PLP-dependent enzyme [Saccharibacillus sp. CPCC 101409]|uniref:aminotransferase class V-fold PLP-dependent enzyme n=1 Tax=Saccharibacillus sp. CPCC 101409 TaxID=3058041 RepID=UPI0026738161|nr:aminotransferase class V-fold PLP-dependent enzyme [Saccharibacillus sp. CPCC 101409]MDO3413231.1 aminotransferase class V-fold PLP-dependent enzyme [Saccharibacillus sp. CPCC 101409]